MNGLELSKKYFEEYGMDMLKKDFSEILPLLCVGFAGSGSDKYGFDDEISKDHDFEPGFCVFLPDEEKVDRRTEFLLERAYSKLPKEFYGEKRQQISPVGGNRNGIIRTSDFYLSHIGNKDGNLTVDEWLHIPDYAFFEATNGEVYFDNLGEFTEIRQSLINMPNDIKLKRIAGNLLVMAQSGQYNFNRCLKHNEPQAAQLSINEFVTSSLKVIFLLTGKYMPYYKWSFRALKDLKDGEMIHEKLSYLLFGDNADEYLAEQKYLTVEEIADYVISELKERGMTKAICADLEKHAYSVNDMIEDSYIRNLNIFDAI